MITFLGYQEVNRKFTFREKASLTIPKSVRQVAYTLAVDVEILSVGREQYKNFKSNPSHGFYGYAILVLQDFTSLKIELENGRQRIYYGTLPNAYDHWYNLFLWFFDREVWKYFLNSRLPVTEAAVGASVGSATFTCPSAGMFTELPLREVYVKCNYGTTIRMEVTYEKPIPIVYEGCSFDGSSRKLDSPKDNGLPPNGTQPQTATDPNNPYSGFPSPSSDLELEDFKNNKQDNLDNPNPLNAPINQAGVWTIVGVYRDYQDIGSNFPYTVSVNGFANDNPMVVAIGFVSADCPYKTIVRSSFDARNMGDVGCSSKVEAQTSSFSST